MKRLYVIFLLLMLFYVSMLLGAYENDVVNRSLLPIVKSSLRDNFWDFETGLQGWTHTNGLPFPAGWDVKPSNYMPSYVLPDAGDSTMWIDAEQSGGTFWIQDTALSPAIVPPINMVWLKYGYVNVTYVGYFYNELHVGIRYFTGGVWNTVELQFYPASATSGPAWDSVDVSAYSTVDSVRVYFYFDDFYTWGYYAAFDNVGLYALLDHDVGCAGIVSPPGGYISPGEYDLIARIRNYGAFAETFDVTAGVWDTTGGAWIQIFNQTITLTDFPVGGDSLVNFGQCTFYDNCYFFIEVCTMLSGDQNPSNDCCSSGPLTVLQMGDIVFEMDVETPTGDNQCLGVEFDGTYFYVTGGNSGSDPNKVYVIDTLGTLIWTMEQPAHSTGWGWRDFCWDETYAGPDRIDTLYAILNNNIDVFGIDLIIGFLTWYGSVPAPVSSVSALAYMPDSLWFFTASSDSVYRFSKISPNIISVPNPGYAICGAAYDPGVTGVEGPWVWWHSQDDPGTGWAGQIEQFDPLTMTFTGIVFGYMPTITVPAVAGGLCFYEGFRGCDVLFALVQGTPDAIVGLYVRGYVDVTEKPEKKMPMVFGLSNIAPNPVRDGATVTYTTTKRGPVNLKVYDSAGRLVKTLIDRKITSAGGKTVYWDGRDNNHQPVSAGVYFCRLTAEGKTATNKMVIVR